MTIIVSGGEKGGTGKTMLATSLAVCFASRGVDVLLVDADGQGSSTRWATGRAELLNKAAAADAPASKLKRIPWVVLRGNCFHALRDLEPRYGIIIVDGGGADSEEFTTSVTTADAVYTTIVPSDCDLGTLPTVNKAISHIRDLGRTDLLARIVLNCCSWRKGATDQDEARAFIAEHAPLFTPTQAAICYRDPFKYAYRDRVTVTEYAAYWDRKTRESARIADVELSRVFAEIAHEIGLGRVVPKVHDVPEVPQVHSVPEVHEA